MFLIHQPCGTALFPFPATVQQSLEKKVCAVMLSVASAVISGTCGLVGACCGSRCLNGLSQVSNKQTCITASHADNQSLEIILPVRRFLL